MAKRITRDDFINMASKIYPHIDFSNCTYINTETKIDAVCSKHGLFYREPKKFLKRGGCPKCSYETIAKKNSKTKEQYISEVVSNHGDIFDFSESIYNGVLNNITVKCFYHGYLNATARSFLVNGCVKCKKEKRIASKRATNKDNLIKKYKEIRKEIDFSDFEYNGIEPSIFKCKKHGYFKMRASYLSIKGCSECGNEKRGSSVLLSQDGFLLRARSTHGDKYDYSKSVYKGRKSIIKIKCSEHGFFKQRANDHLSGNGCQECAKDSALGFKKSQFINGCNKRKIKHASLYLIKCFNDNESFYKIGITCRTIKARFSGVSRLPYNYIEIAKIINDPLFIWDQEKRIHKILKPYKYKPKINFGGSGECFTTLNNEVLDFFGVRNETA